MLRLEAFPLYTCFPRPENSNSRYEWYGMPSYLYPARLHTTEYRIHNYELLVATQMIVVVVVVDLSSN